MSNNSNSNSQERIFSTELGEVKEALGRLYKEYESFKLSQKAERERDRAELQAWAQTNLIQNQLLSKTMATIELLTKELKNQGVSSSEFEQSNENLKLELIRFMEQFLSTQRSSPASDNLELKGLKSEVAGLKNTLNQIWQELKEWKKISINQLLRSVNSKMTEINDQIMEVRAEVGLAKPCTWGIVIFTLLVSLVALFFVLNFMPVHLSGQMEATFNEIWDRTGYTNTKLQRIEKHLGTEPKPE